MPVNHKLKTVFIHIPKCAGTSITQMLDMTTLEQLFFCGSPNMYTLTHKIYADKFSLFEYSKLIVRPPQHFFLKEVSKILGNEVMNSYYVFSVVRNPYSRIVSAFNRALQRYAGQSGFDSFENFVETQLVLPEYQRISKFQGHLETQTSYLKNNDGNLDSIKKIFKFENLEECYAKITEIYPNVPFLHANASPEEYNYKTFYTDDLANKVYAFYKDDFDNFGYSPSLTP